MSENPAARRRRGGIVRRAHFGAGEWEILNGKEQPR